jgi:hypothetical protein
MSDQENYSAFFTPDTEVSEPKSAQTDEYNPSAAKGKNNLYQSVIRFIPWYQNPKSGSIQEKWVSYLQDPITNRGRYIDCPSSVGKPSPLQDIYWKLKKSESVQEQKLADTFSRRHSYASLIQVIRDENAPELEGKIMVWRYGVKIWEKINSELKPVIGDKHDPFNIIDGKIFALIIAKVSGFNNYDQSKFLDKKIPLCLPGPIKDGKPSLEPINANTDKAMVFNWVKENSPDLSKYSYREWDQETFDYVNHVITSVTGQGSVSQKYDNIVNRETPAASAPVAGISSTDISVEDLDLGAGLLGTGGLDLPELDTLDIPSIGGITGSLDDIINGS